MKKIHQYDHFYDGLYMTPRINKTRRICLFAAYDKNGIVHDYVVHYLKELSCFADIYYMAECEMPLCELEKIESYVKASYAYKHGKYDFGSWQELVWKVGYHTLAQYDELILTNDSGFAPLQSLDAFFNRADADTEWDALGMLKNYDMASGVWYVSSCFTMLRKKLFQSDVFRKLIESIKPQKDFTQVSIKYEFPFAKGCIKQGYVVKYYCPYIGRVYSEWRELIKHDCLFLKKKSFTGYSNTEMIFWKRFIKKQTNYDPMLIEKYISDSKLYENNKNIRLKMAIRYVTKVISWFIYFQFYRGKRKLRIFGVWLINNRPNGNEAYYEDGTITLLKK